MTDETNKATVPAGSDPESKRRLRRLLMWGAVGMIIVPTACMVALVWFSRGSPDRLRPSRPIPGRTRTDAVLAGTWKVGGGSRAGYRAPEKFVAMPSVTEAVGRTTDITGTFELSESGDSVRLVAADFTANLATLSSDQPERDEALRTRGLETDKFPTAHFVLDEAIDIPAEALRHRLVRIEAPGTLTLHGVSRQLDFEMEAQLLGDDRVELTAAQGIELADYGVERLGIARVLKIEPQATIEFQLLAEHQP